jgi:hypothetical protein
MLRILADHVKDKAADPENAFSIRLAEELRKGWRYVPGGPALPLDKLFPGCSFTLTSEEKLGPAKRGPAGGP